MRHQFATGAALAALIFTMPVLAQTAAPAAPAAAAATGARVPPAFIIVVDRQAILERSAAGKDRDGKLKAWADGVRNKDKVTMDTFQKERDDLQRRQPTIDPAAFEAQAKQFETKWQKPMGELQNRENELRARAAYANDQILNGLNKVIPQVMSERGANITLWSDAAGLAISAVTVTDQVISRLDAQLRAVTIELPARTAAPATPATPPK
jgi:Skp family chaperone for outer membrane proteins